MNHEIQIIFRNKLFDTHETMRVLSVKVRVTQINISLHQ